MSCAEKYLITRTNADQNPFSNIYKQIHDYVIKRKHFPRYWSFVRGVHRSRWIQSVTRNFDVFFDLRLNQQLSIQWRRRWIEMPSRSLWRYCNIYNAFTSDSVVLGLKSIAFRGNYISWRCDEAKQVPFYSCEVKLPFEPLTVHG